MSTSGTGIAAGARWVVGLNSGLQNAENGLATLYSALNRTDIGTGLNFARSAIKGLREDAKKGVGELRNYIEGFQAILAPGLQSGTSVDAMRELTRNALAAFNAMRPEDGIQFAPIQMRRALTAGANLAETPQVVAALQAAGVTMQAFNRMDPAKRIETLNEAFKLFAPGVEQMGKSWDARMSTLGDNVKALLADVGKPLFDRWSEQLAKANDWFVKNEDAIGAIVDRWGPKLVDLWDHLIRQAGTYAAIVAGAALAPHLAGAGQGAAGAASSARAALPGIAAGLKDPFGMSRMFSGGILGSSAGTTTGIFAMLRGGLASLGRLAGPVALVMTAFLALKGGLEEYPAVLGFIGERVQDLGTTLTRIGDAFGSLTTKGSALNIVGAGLAAVFGGVLFGVDLLLRAFGSLVVGFGVVLQIIGDGFKAIWLAANGRFAEAAQISVADRLSVANEQLRNLWTFSDDDQKKLEEAGTPGGGTPTKGGDTNFNGPITFHLKTEQNADPARVLTAFDEGVERLRIFKRQAKRLPAYGV
ncbi:MAG: hypothetical protein L0221_19090 [Chloroflexi bacterium]|nr:hypothetical protein [Chloroflexota bacterium]